MNRLQVIRQQEKEYHDHCYEHYKLFQAGTWMHKPVQTVLEMYRMLESQPELQILDLGCGVGRNSIPLAQGLQHRAGKVVCVDLLESAIAKLYDYANEYGAAQHIDGIVSDIGSFAIERNAYDFIVAVSSLEHLASEEQFDRVLLSMIEGTKDEGIHCFIISTNISETLLESGEQIDPMYELNFSTDSLTSKLQHYYADWKLLKHTIKPYHTEIAREGRQILLKGDVVTWAVQKQQS